MAWKPAKIETYIEVAPNLFAKGRSTRAYLYRNKKVKAMNKKTWENYKKNHPEKFNPDGTKRKVITAAPATPPPPSSTP